jgi:phosphoribosylformylglycinamidine synthase
MNTQNINSITTIITLNPSGKSYLIQYEYQRPNDILALNCILAYHHQKLQQKIIAAIAKVLGQDLADSGATLDKPFIAPYTNFITIDSTTLIEIINKCRLLPVGAKIKLIRIEEIAHDLITEYDKLTHRVYSSLDEYSDNTGFLAQCLGTTVSSNGSAVATQEQAEKNRDFDVLSSDELIRELGLSTRTSCQATRFDIEDWKQCNSEHSRHWFFRTPIPYLGKRSLFDLVKSTLTANPRAQTNSLVAFSDNSSAIKSVIPRANYLARTGRPTGTNGEFVWQSSNRPGMHPCLTAETHNFPTYYHPFEGANTGIGGRIRDNLAVGTGSLSSASWVGYSMSDLDMMMRASDGASNYANKVGEPLLGGYLRWHPMFAKPILYTAGVGWIADDKLLTPETRVQPGDLVIKVGPQAFKIGLGGSLMSSVDNSATGAQDALTAVQRGDPYEGNKVIRFCEYLATQPRRLIHKIHDQGAGGLGNVVKELVEPYSAEIDLSQLPHAPGMTTLECWLSEYQEQIVFTAPAGNLDELQRLATREGCGLFVLGRILPPSGPETDPDPVIHLTGIAGEKYDFHYQRLAREIPELAERFNPILSGYQAQMTGNRLMLGPDEPNPEGLYMIRHQARANTFEMILHNLEPQRDLKLWLTTKIDRSVGGCVIQQPHVGPYGLPMSDYGILAANPDGSGGWQISAVGENIWVGQTPWVFAIKAIAELVGNLAGSGIQDLSQVKLSANWMWYIKSPEYCDLMVQCAEALTNGLIGLDLAIDGGKDSLSMSIDMPDGERIVSPPSLVLAGYASVPSGTPRATPVLGQSPRGQDGDYNEFTWLWGLDLMLLLSAVEPEEVKAALGWIFTGVRDGSILAIHDGDTLRDTIEEMCLVSVHGFATEADLAFTNICPDVGNPLSSYQHHWLVWQSTQEPPKDLLINYPNVFKLGRVLPNSREIYSISEPWITRCHQVFHKRMATTLKQMPILQVSREYLSYQPWEYRWSHEAMQRLPTAEEARKIGSGRRVAIIRDMGSNSHREMAAVFLALGCSEVLDITINDLLGDTANPNPVAQQTQQTPQIPQIQQTQQQLLNCDGLVFVGGFAYGDVLGSGNATAQVIRSRPELLSIIQQISRDPAKFILGVCNGAQIILALGLFPTPVKLVANNSERFESWFLPVDTLDGQQLGIWCAHGEGRFQFPQVPPGIEGKFEFPQDSIGNGIELVGKFTSSEYPANPNGSQFNAIGIRTMTSINSKKMNEWQGANIIAIMPHPERSVFKTQCEYIPPELLEATRHTPFTPWIEFFVGLFTSC